MALYKRIKDLREDADKTQKEIADYLGTSVQYYGQYESGLHELPFFRAIELAKYYHVSLDYLGERTNFKRGNNLTKEENNLIMDWRKLSERDKGKVEYLISELLKNKE